MKSKKNIIKLLALHKNDVGSTEVQIGIISEKIKNLSEHFKKFKKDNHSTRGLTKSVNQRKRLLQYLSKRNPKTFCLKTFQASPPLEMEICARRLWKS